MKYSILDIIGNYHRTDKSSILHGYLEKYQKFLPFSRGAKISILEIGVFEGNSLRTWRDYFFNATVVGIDINPDCKAQEQEEAVVTPFSIFIASPVFGTSTKVKKVKIEIGSQTDDNFLDYPFGCFKKKSELLHRLNFLEYKQEIYGISLSASPKYSFIEQLSTSAELSLCS